MFCCYIKEVMVLKESVWGYAILTMGIIAIMTVWFLTNVTNTDQQNYNLLKETVEASMMDSIDLAAYRTNGDIKINEEKFVESFVRRFAENVSLKDNYRIEIYDINEEPPKVSLKVYSNPETNVNGEVISFNISNSIDAILETKF